jgi:hypothetical protein
MFDELNKPANDEFADPGNRLGLASEGPPETAEPSPARGQSWASALSKSTWAMVGVFIVGVALVALLSLRGGPSKANATDRDAEQKVDLFIAQSQQQQGKTVQSFQDTKQVVSDFYNYASRRQVPVDDLKSNPFIFGKSPTTTGNVSEGMTPRRLAELQRLCASYRLQSILMGARGGTAIIDSNFVAVGHRVGPFTVKAIYPKSVDLVCEGTTFTLRLAE